MSSKARWVHPVSAESLCFWTLLGMLRWFDTGAFGCGVAPGWPKRVSRSRSSLRHEIRSETRCPIACTHGSPRMCHRESRPSIVPKSTQVEGQTSPDTTLKSSTASAAHWPGRKRAAGSRVQGEVDEQIFQGSDRRSTVRWPVTRRPRHRAPDRVTNLSACSVWKTTHANMLAMIA
jgi:hypothetical protein